MMLAIEQRIRLTERRKILLLKRASHDPKNLLAL
jgi:hypothetical protein